MAILDLEFDFLSPLVVLLLEFISSSLLPSKLLCLMIVSLLILPSPYSLDLEVFISLMPQLYQPRIPNLLMDGSWGEFDFIFRSQEKLNPTILDEELDFPDLKESPE